MEDKKAINVYEYLTSFFLPEGMLDFFEVVWADEMSLSSREQKQAIVYKRVLKVHLDERDNRTEEQQALRPNGFTEPTIVADFPSRDRRMEPAHPPSAVADPRREERHIEHLSACRCWNPVLRRVRRVLEKKTWMQSR